MGESTIINWIIPFLSVGKRGFSSKYYFAKIIQLIFKRLKTGCQWREIPIKEQFEEGEISWNTIYYYFNKWSKDGSFQRIWLNILEKNKSKLDLCLFKWIVAIVKQEEEKAEVIKVGNQLIQLMLFSFVTTKVRC